MTRVLVCRGCGGLGWVWVTEPPGAEAGDPGLFPGQPTETRTECPDCAGDGVRS